MNNPLRKLEIEWRIMVLAAVVLLAFAWPMQRIYTGRLQQTLDQSVDPGLEPLLRNYLNRGDGSIDTAVVNRIQRTRQWQAVMPIIVREQSQAIFCYAAALFITLLIVATWSARRLTRPLRDLSRAAALIGRGEKARIVQDATGALGILQKNMSGMQDELDMLRQKAKTQGMESAWRDIARVMAHEIKNPLTPIQLTLDRIQEKVIMQKPLAPEELQRFVGRISSQVGNLERLVNDFRSFAREPEAQIRQIPLHSAIGKIADDMKGSLQTYHDGQAVIAADPFLLNQVFLNIWKNAAEADADRIDTVITQTGFCTTLAIRDNGAGIAPEHLPRIWVPYETFKKGGTGLGLPVVKRLLEAMNAHVGLESFYNCENHGTLITITFVGDESISPKDASDKISDTHQRPAGRE
ncbi:MAG: ATP-binding protein, partial [Chitinispirillaceae bacterium]